MARPGRRPVRRRRRARADLAGGWQFDAGTPALGRGELDGMRLHGPFAGPVFASSCSSLLVSAAMVSSITCSRSFSSPISMMSRVSEMSALKASSKPAGMSAGTLGGTLVVSPEAEKCWQCTLVSYIDL